MTEPAREIPPIFELDYDRRIAALRAAKLCLENNGGQVPTLLAVDAAIHAFIEAYENS